MVTQLPSPTKKTETSDSNKSPSTVPVVPETDSMAPSSSQSKPLTPATVTKEFVQELPPRPFPQRLKKVQQDKQFGKFIEVLKQLHINIPLVDALQQMSNYTKFMKDVLTKRRRIGEFETVAMTQESSLLMQSKTPKKLKDPGSFTIPCTIGDTYCGQALCDLGASINLMPKSIF